MRGVLVVLVSLGMSSVLAAQVVVPAKLSLADALRLADERSPDLRVARSEVDAVVADRITAAARPNPALTFDTVGYPPLGGAPPANQTLSVRVDQEIETSGRRGLRVQSADEARVTADRRYSDARRRVALAVQRAYWQAALAWADHQTAESVLADIDRTINLSRARAAQGEIAGAEVRRLELERLRFVEDLFAADLALKNGRAALLTLMGVPDLTQPFEPIENLASSLGVVTSTGVVLVPLALDAPVDADVVRATALLARPDLLALESEAVRLDTETRLQRALRTPNVTIGGGYQRDLGQSAVIFGATIPLPFANRNQGPVARADAERAGATARTEALRNLVLLDVQQAVNAVIVNRQRVKYLQTEYLANALAARDTSLASYRLGAGDLLEYLDAQRVYRDTLRTYNRALFDAKVSLSELAAAAGAAVGGSSSR